MPNTRPKNLNLFTIHFPIPAIVSILHRLSGLLLFVSIPFILWVLSLSLTLDGFYAIKAHMDNIFIKFITWVLLSAFFYHAIAGIKHLLLDLHIASNLKAARCAAFFTIAISIVLAILIGIWLW